MLTSIPLRLLSLLLNILYLIIHILIFHESLSLLSIIRIVSHVLLCSICVASQISTGITTMRFSAKPTTHRLSGLKSPLWPIIIKSTSILVIRFILISLLLVDSKLGHRPRSQSSNIFKYTCSSIHCVYFTFLQNNYKENNQVRIYNNFLFASSTLII